MPASEGGQPAAVELSTRVVTRPAVVCEIDTNLLKGEVRRLSWSPNSQSIHIQTRDPRTERLYDYIIDLETREVSLAFGEPVWAAHYWARKSALVAPALPSLKLEVTEHNRRTRPTPFTGPMNSGAGQTPDPRNPVDAYEHEVTLRFEGEEIGNWINGAPMAGDTFSWGPDGSGALAFTDKSGRVILIDRARRKLVIEGVKDAGFPAWSIDGAHLAWLQKAGRRKYKLVVTTVTAPST
jgi:hypothetical protein